MAVLSLTKGGLIEPVLTNRKPGIDNWIFSSFIFEVTYLKRSSYYKV